MNVLYKGNYYKRFDRICRLISGKSVTELCFGDIIIADYCKNNSIQWAGIDSHPGFVKNAQKKGYNAQLNLVQALEKFPKADTCIMSGSLYHFHDNLEHLFTKMLSCAPEIIISEPVMNLSSRKGIIGKLAKGSATINGQQQHFRFTETSLIAVIEILSKKLNFKYTITDRFNKDLIIVIQK